MSSSQEKPELQSILGSYVYPIHIGHTHPATDQNTFRFLDGTGKLGSFNNPGSLAQGPSTAEVERWTKDVGTQVVYAKLTSESPQIHTEFSSSNCVGNHDDRSSFSSSLSHSEEERSIRCSTTGMTTEGPYSATSPNGQHCLAPQDPYSSTTESLGEHDVHPSIFQHMEIDCPDCKHTQQLTGTPDTLMDNSTELPVNSSKHDILQPTPESLVLNDQDRCISYATGHCPSETSSRNSLSDVPSLSAQSDPQSSITEASPTPSSVTPLCNEDTPGEPIATARFLHKQDENGNHVILGREGEIMHCEDEPIRTPGAVQGFGILIAVHEDLEHGTLVVRQVSENSSELLGLSPQHLFSLACFTDTLPDSQAEILWDNIQFLDHNAEGQEVSPHVFLLTGWRAPTADDKETDNERRSWTCWCAAHRSGTSSSGHPGIIIMEFELEHDTHNPLCLPTVSHHSSFTSTTSDAKSLDGSGCSLARTSDGISSGRIEPTDPQISHSASGSPPTCVSSTSEPLVGLKSADNWSPSAEDIRDSTTSHAKLLPALEHMRRMTGTSVSSHPPTGFHIRRGSKRVVKNAGAKNSGVGVMDIFAAMAQINEQFGAASDLETFLKIVVGVIKDLTGFHRVLVYQFDKIWNGQVVAELVDWNQTHDLYQGLHFPASDIPAQARELYTINKVRLLYDASQTTSRIVVRSIDDLKIPLNMTHCYLRAMSPVHIKYLGNMGVRASMSVSIMAFGALWGLVTCHSYGSHGMRVSFPIRQMLRLLSYAISRNIERLSYARRLHIRKLINTTSSEHHPTGYIVSNADDLLGLFDADFGILVIGEGAKVLGPNQHRQEILVVLEYLRLKRFGTIQVSQTIAKDFPDLQVSSCPDIIAGLLYIPLSDGGKDFIAFLRKGQPRYVHWAGKPYKDADAGLEPRKSFEVWSETVAGRCRVWADEQLETAGVLALVYGKFIEVWRQKENALQTTKLTNMLLSNASHEVRTPLNHIINYLEMALDGHLDSETRDNLNRSHAASKNLLFTINDLLDLTRLESGNEILFKEPFDLQLAIEEATQPYVIEAERRDIKFKVDVSESPKMVMGDSKKICTVVANLTANALKYTSTGSVTISCNIFSHPDGLHGSTQTAMEIVVEDTGCGIARDKLELMFCEFVQVESTEPKGNSSPSFGLGLAVVARIAQQLGGQLRVDSKVDEGSRFSFLIPALSPPRDFETLSNGSSAQFNSRRNSQGSEIDFFVEALVSNHMGSTSSSKVTTPQSDEPNPMEHLSSPETMHGAQPGTFKVAGSNIPIRPVRVDEFDLDPTLPGSVDTNWPLGEQSPVMSSLSKTVDDTDTDGPTQLRVLIVEDNVINRTILAKRLCMVGHQVVNTSNGQEGLDKVESDREFDCVLMDIQMPILNGFQATKRIRDLEQSTPTRPEHPPRRKSHELNGRIPIFAVSASLLEKQRDELAQHGMDGWILKPIDFKRLNIILKGVTDLSQREQDFYRPGCNWEVGGWLRKQLVDTVGGVQADAWRH